MRNYRSIYCCTQIINIYGGKWPPCLNPRPGINRTNYLIINYNRVINSLHIYHYPLEPLNPKRVFFLGVCEQSRGNIEHLSIVFYLIFTAQLMLNYGVVGLLIKLNPFSQLYYTIIHVHASVPVNNTKI